MYSNQYLIKRLCGYVIGALVGLGYDCFVCRDLLEAPVWYKLYAEYGAYVQK